MPPLQIVIAYLLFPLSNIQIYPLTSLVTCVGVTDSLFWFSFVALSLPEEDWK